MKIIRYILLFLWLPVLSAGAQHADVNRVQVSNPSIVLGPNKQLMVNMDVILPAGLKVRTNQALVLTPTLRSTDGVYNKVLPAVWVYGRTRHIVHKRTNDIPADAYEVLLRNNGTGQHVSYDTRVMFEKWMSGAELDLVCAVNGCADCREDEYVTPSVARAVLERHVVKPTVSFVAPAVEEIKNREVKGSAYLDFPVNQTTIYPDYRRNPAELARIKATADVVHNDSNTYITGIDITGFASPEGSYANNIRLAKGRAEALKKYVMNEYGFKGSLFRVSSTPEDWEGLRKYVEQSTLSAKDEILTIIDREEDNLDAKEWRIRAVDGGKLYATLLEDCYPALRHSDYVVHYVVRPFDVEEAARIIRERPQQLSLQEMYQVAHTYEKGSEQFGEVFDIAVRMFPEDPTANINAAAVALQKNDLKLAERYLEKAGEVTPAVLNNRGVLKLLQGKLDEAEALFRQADTPEAAANLKEVASKRADVAIFE